MGRRCIGFMLLAASVYAQDMVKVTGERVSLRAAPNTQAVLLARTAPGDELILKDNSDSNWVGVLPPATVDLWVNREFISNNIVLPQQLNIRSGPSLSHSVVGTAQKGDEVTVRGEIADWLRIAPTSNTIVWISRAYVEAPESEVMEPVVVEPVVAEPAAEKITTEVEVPVTGEKKMTLDSVKKQGVEGVYSGVLQPNDARLYRLMDDHFADIAVCYVSGNTAQMQTFSGMKLEITGKVYWVEGLDLPVIRPDRIKPFATDH